MFIQITAGLKCYNCFEGLGEGCDVILKYEIENCNFNPEKQFCFTIFHKKDNYEIADCGVGEFWLHKGCNAGFRNGDVCEKAGTYLLTETNKRKTVTAKVSCCHGDLCNDLERHDYKNTFSNQNSSSNNLLNHSALLHVIIVLFILCFNWNRKYDSTLNFITYVYFFFYSLKLN